MNDPRKIEYYNLREEAQGATLPTSIGRQYETERLSRALGRRVNSNALVVAPYGMGKTTFVYEWVRRACAMPAYEQHALLQLTVEHLSAIDSDSALEEWYAEAFSSMPACVLVIDDFGREVYRNATLMQRVYRLYKQLLANSQIHVVLLLEPHEFSWLEREHPAFVHLFETIHLKEQTTFEYSRILSNALPRLNARHRVIVPDSALQEIVSLAMQFPSLGQMPKSAIQLLDESISLSATKNRKVLSHDTIARVVESKTGVPRARLSHDELESVKGLEHRLNERIVNQHHAIGKIASILRRAKLGLRSPNKPLGSFLLLGPSGDRQQQTANSVAEIMFGRPESFLRFDMSEFQQEHTVQRLIGAPAGYVGYEEGGALINALKRNPYSLILLDEIEKAHPKVFDIFLQVLDEGRLTSGQNDTVDARNVIVMATSNAGVAEILQAHESGTPVHEERFIKEQILPILANTFRLEFINRFDNLLVFNPLAPDHLLAIAQLELTKMQDRVSKHRVRFEMDTDELKKHIQHLSDPRFGARPVKRFIEETCESLLAESLLSA